MGTDYICNNHSSCSSSSRIHKLKLQSTSTAPDKTVCPQQASIAVSLSLTIHDVAEQHGVPPAGEHYSLSLSVTIHDVVEQHGVSPMG